PVALRDPGPPPRSVARRAAAGPAGRSAAPDPPAGERAPADPVSPAVTGLRLRLLGVPEASLGGRPVAFRRRTSLALLAYLAVTGRRHSRAALAGFLAGDLDEAQAHKRIDNALNDLRAAAGGYVTATREWVALDGELPHWVDVAAF